MRGNNRFFKPFNYKIKLVSKLSFWCLGKYLFFDSVDGFFGGFMGGLGWIQIWWILNLHGAEEVDEAEDYEAPGSNPGKELWNMKMCSSIRKAISNSLHGTARSRTGPHPLIRYIWEAYACNMISKWVEVEPQRRTADIVGSWCKRRKRNISSKQRCQRLSTPELVGKQYLSWGWPVKAVTR
jgi:hypothetical protein